MKGIERHKNKKINKIEEIKIEAIREITKKGLKN